MAKPFTLDHFRKYAELLVFDDGEKRGLEDWQFEIVADIFKGYREVWGVLPEGNGKSTMISTVALYGADYSQSPWIPIGASTAKQARIIYDQAAGFVQRTEGMEDRFKCFGGYKLIRSKRNGGLGIEVFAADAGGGDGVIPFPYAICDELHRTDMTLYRLWKGKLRKRSGQIIGISTAGEPETPFEQMRDDIRRKASKRDRKDAHLRAEGSNLVLHEWMVASDDECSDMEAVKAANPLSTITTTTLKEDFESPTTDLGDWKRLKCNRPTRSSQSAITDKEWDDAEVEDDIPEGKPVMVGFDVGWKWDTTAIQPLWVGPNYRLLGAPKVLVPPRDGNQLHPDEIKNAYLEIAERNPIEVVVADMHRAEDICAWLEDEMGLTVIERQQSNTALVADYDAFMDGLRNGTLKHTGDPEQRRQVLNAVARRLPGGDYRFDRSVTTRSNVGAQDRRVIDVLSAASMVVEYSNRAEPELSVYEKRALAAAA
jgi:phage terminase large subunit-like protein